MVQKNWAKAHTSKPMTTGPSLPNVSRWQDSDSHYAESNVGQFVLSWNSERGLKRRMSFEQFVQTQQAGQKMVGEEVNTIQPKARNEAQRPT